MSSVVKLRKDALTKTGEVKTAEPTKAVGGSAVKAARTLQQQNAAIDATAAAGSSSGGAAPTAAAASASVIIDSDRSAAVASSGDEKVAALDAAEGAAVVKKKSGKRKKSKSKSRKAKGSTGAAGAAGASADLSSTAASISSADGTAGGAGGAASGSQPPADGSASGTGNASTAAGTDSKNDAAGGAADGTAGGGAAVSNDNGLRSCFLTRKAVERWDLGVGISPSTTPCGVVYKKLSREALLADIQTFGANSEFHSLSNDIKAYTGTEILFIREDAAGAGAGAAEDVSQSAGGVGGAIAGSGGMNVNAGAGGAGIGSGGLAGPISGSVIGQSAVGETGVYDYKFCATEEAFNREWTRIQKAEAAFEQKMNGGAANGAGYGKDPKDAKGGSGGSSTALTAWDKDSPFLVKARYVAQNFRLSEGVEDDVRRLHIKKKRGGVGQYGIPTASANAGGAAPASSAIGYFITQPRFQFGAQYEFSDTAEVVHGFPHKVFSRWQIERKELSMGFQASSLRLEASTQTHWARQVNKITQYEPNTMTDDDAARLMTDVRMEKFLNSFVDTVSVTGPNGPGTSGVRPAKRPGDVTERLMTLALEHNETVDLFKDEFKEFADEDSQIGQKADNNLKDAGAYTHSKANQNIVAIDWHPSQNKTSIVAFCCAHNLTFDKWVDAHSGKVLSSQIMFVNFSSDIIKPYIMLEGPGNLQCFQLNTANPNIVAGGLMTGQVIFWDVTEFADRQLSLQNSSSATAAAGAAAATAKANRGKDHRTGHHHEEFDAKNFHSHEASTTKPRAMSYIDKSHSRPVTDVRWLPPGVEITRRGDIIRSKTKLTHQFVTTSGDGILSFWDTRLKDTYKTGNSLEDAETAEPKWIPTYSIPLMKPDRSGLLAATKLALGSDTKMFVVTEDGEVATVDWSLAKMDEKDKVTTLAVTSVRRAHFQPCTAVERCPHFPDIYLTVGDWSFIIWQDGVEDPIFVSPGINAENQLVAARWSPTRAGVIITALSSGYVEIWDLMDQIHHHSFSFKCSESSIASLEFWKSRVVLDQKQGPVANPHLQYLAVGDVTGRLRLLQMPKNLRKKQDMREERNLIRQFFDREIARAAYAKKRAAVRAAEKKAVEEAQHALDVQNAEKLAALQAQHALLGGPLAALGLGPNAGQPAGGTGLVDQKFLNTPGGAGLDTSASAAGSRSASALGMNSKEAKEWARRRKQEQADKLREEKAAEDRKRIEAEELEEREYQTLHDHYKKLFSDESFAAKSFTINLAAAAATQSTITAAAAPPPVAPPSARVKF